jgi:hypothetical protein
LRLPLFVVEAVPKCRVHALQLGVLLAEPLQLLALARRQRLRPQPAVGLGLPHPLPQRLLADPQVANIGFLVGIRNRGETLEDAFINVMVSERAGYLRRVSATGAAIESGTAHPKFEKGRNWLYWQERGLVVPGFGTNTDLWFAVDTTVRDLLQVIFRLGATELGTWVASSASIVTGVPGYSGPPEGDWIDQPSGQRK